MGGKNVLCRTIKYFHTYVMGGDSSLSGDSDPIVYKKTFFELLSLLKLSMDLFLKCCQSQISGCGVNSPFSL